MLVSIIIFSFHICLGSADILICVGNLELEHLQPLSLLWFGYFSFGILRVMNWSNISFMWKGVNKMKDSNLLISSTWDKENQQLRAVSCGSPDLFLNRLAFDEKKSEIESSMAGLGPKLFSREWIRKESMSRLRQVNRLTFDEVRRKFDEMKRSMLDVNSSILLLVDTEFQDLNTPSTTLLEICAMTASGDGIFQRESTLLIRHIVKVSLYF